MPYSEISMHHSAMGRIGPYKHLLGKNVTVSRNLYLVMGKDEAELSNFAIATVFAIQTAPWRLEVDLWRSFCEHRFGHPGKPQGQVDGVAHASPKDGARFIDEDKRL